MSFNLLLFCENSNQTTPQNQMCDNSNQGRKLPMIYPKWLKEFSFQKPFTPYCLGIGRVISILWYIKLNPKTRLADINNLILTHGHPISFHKHKLSPTSFQRWAFYFSFIVFLFFFFKVKNTSCTTALYSSVCVCVFVCVCVRACLCCCCTSTVYS